MSEWETEYRVDHVNFHSVRTRQSRPMKNETVHPYEGLTSLRGHFLILPGLSGHFVVQSNSCRNAGSQYRWFGPPAH